MERLIETANTLLNTEEEEHEVETRNDDWKRPTPHPQVKQTRSLQDMSYMQSMYDEQDFESEEELGDFCEEKLAEDPMDSAGGIAYKYDSYNIDLSDDEFFLREIELARPSSVDPGC